MFLKPLMYFPDGIECCFSMRRMKHMHTNKNSCRNLQFNQGVPDSSIPSLKGNERGFTLIELLIAITLLALISVVVYSAIWTASRSLHAVEERVAVNDEIRVTQQFLRQALSQSRGVMAIDDGVMGVVFQGERDVITFVAPAPLQRGIAGGLFRYRLALTGKTRNESSLHLSFWQYMPGNSIDDELAPKGEAVLSDGVEELRFSYYGSKKPDTDQEWLDEWTRSDSLPMLVKIVLKRATDDAALTMIVAIKGQVG